MPRTTPRIHRLPQRLDYTLIPPPLDLSLPLASEKSPLPTIIVTPSSPSSSRDFAIAFLAPPPKPSVLERVLACAAPLQLRARTAIILLLIAFVMLCHVFTHRLAARRPHLEFSIAGAGGALGGEPRVVEAPFGGWFNFRALLDPPAAAGDTPVFVVTEDAGM